MTTKMSGTLMLIAYVIAGFSAVKAQTSFVVGGQVFAGINTLDKGTAVIYKNDGGNFLPYDTCSIDTFGYYYFLNISTGDYIVKVEPADVSIFGGDYSFTYYGNVCQWEYAGLLIPEGNIFDADINLVKFQKQTGHGTIDGKVLDKAGVSFENASVLLLSQFYLPVAADKSDTNGNFSFDNLAYGTYVLCLEATGEICQDVIVILSQQTPNIINLILQSGGYANAGNVLMNGSLSAGCVFPNPFKHSGSIEINSPVNTDALVEVYSLEGRLVFSEKIELMQGLNIHKILIPFANNGKYIYLLKVKKLGNLKRLFVKI